MPLNQFFKNLLLQFPAVTMVSLKLVIGFSAHYVGCFRVI